MPDKHAVFSPSSTARWLACPYSVPQPGEEWADDSGLAAAAGTAMHDMAEQCLTHGHDPHTSNVTLCFTVYNEPHELKPEEWKPHVCAYVDHIRSRVEELKDLFGPDAVQLHVEKQVTIVEELCWGTADAIITHPAGLEVWDLKTGRHAVAPDADQFKTYAVGALSLLTPALRADATITLGRVQIQASPAIDSAEVGRKDLERHQERIHGAIKAWESGVEATPESINSECTWCPRNPERAQRSGAEPCRAWEMRAVAAVKAADARIDAAAGKLKLPKPEDVSDEQTRWLLTFFPSLIAWFKKFQAYHDAKARKDGPPEGFRLVPKTTKRRWRKDMDAQAIAAQLEALADCLGADFDPWGARPLRSFTEAIKALGEEHLADLIEKPEGELSLKLDKEAAKAIAALGCIEENDDA